MQTVAPSFAPRASRASLEVESSGADQAEAKVSCWVKRDRLHVPRGCLEATRGPHGRLQLRRPPSRSWLAAGAAACRSAPSAAAAGAVVATAVVVGCAAAAEWYEDRAAPLQQAPSRAARSSRDPAAVVVAV